MKRIKTRDIVNAEAQGDWRRPAPFPGKYPTKVGIVAMLDQPDGKKRFRKYFGAPSYNAALLLAKINQAPKGFVWVAEMDRKGVIVAGSWHLGQRQMAERLTSLNAGLVEFYHPWDRGNPLVSRYLQPFSVKKVSFNGKVHRVYAPTNGKLSVTNHLIPFKRWMEIHRNELGL